MQYESDETLSFPQPRELSSFPGHLNIAGDRLSLRRHEATAGIAAQGPPVRDQGKKCTVRSAPRTM